MGYSTDFSGNFVLDAPLTDEQAVYLNKFAETRRMKRATGTLEGKIAQFGRVDKLVEDFPDSIREAVGLPVGDQGGYFVGGLGYAGQDRDGSILDYNNPPVGQPGLWCQWMVDTDEEGRYIFITWDGGEKFYNYVEWLEYIIQHFLKPWGRTLNGEVEWQGEERDDRGMIVVKNNEVITKIGRIVYE